MCVRRLAIARPIAASVRWLTDAPATTPQATSVCREAEVVSEVVSRSSPDALEHERQVAGSGVSTLSAADHVANEFHRLAYRSAQVGPFIGSKQAQEAKFDVDQRERRRIDRVPKPPQPYIANETSFRRLPKYFKLPNEYELRALYPQSTGLEVVRGEAQCADGNALNIDEDPQPMVYHALFPPDYDPQKTYPVMVALADHHGLGRDFEDMCANFFERPNVRAGLLEQKWIVLCPMISLRYSHILAMEAVVAKFCDWVPTRFNVEHGRIHLFGKGNGAHLALRTVLEFREVALSVTAILGRPNTPFRTTDRPQERARNYNGVHSLVYMPGFSIKQDWVYKFKLLLDTAKVRPAIRMIHFAEVLDHQVYYAINPIEFWNHLQYFRDYNMKMLATSESGYPVTTVPGRSGETSGRPAGE